jgi:predicted permease
VQALQGYFTIGALIVVGFAMGHFGVLTSAHQRMMSKLALLVSSPALMFMLMSKADLSHVFARSALVSILAICAGAVLYLLLVVPFFRPKPAARTMGMVLSSYSNAGNLGLPIAAYALGDVTWIAPILIAQLAVMQPLVLAHLDALRATDSGEPVPVKALITLPFRNPLTVGTVLGLVVNAAHVTIPDVIAQPTTMLGNIAVPAMLLAFGISLRLDPRPTRGPDSLESTIVVAIKTLLQPLVAYLLARYAFGLTPAAVRAVTVVAALPSAQNLYIISMRYGVRELFARDTIFTATAVSFAVILGLVTLLPA